MHTDEVITSSRNDGNTVLADSFQTIPQFVYDTVVEEKGRVIKELLRVTREKDELQIEVGRLNAKLKNKKLVENGS